MQERGRKEGLEQSNWSHSERGVYKGDQGGTATALGGGQGSQHRKEAATPGPLQGHIGHGILAARRSVAVVWLFGEAVWVQPTYCGLRQGRDMSKWKPLSTCFPEGEEVSSNGPFSENEI